MGQFIHTATWRRVPVRIHWATIALWLLILGYLLYRGSSLQQLVWVQLFVLAVYVSILLHELAHVLVAQRSGIQVHDVVLLPIGGAARLDRIVERPQTEVSIALAGPLTNIGFALLLSPVFLLTPSYEWFPWAGNYTPVAFIACLAAFNLLIGLMNMLPIFPLDGGRVLCALLALRSNRTAAVRSASYIAWALLAVAITWSFFNNPVYLYYLIPFALYATVAIEREHFHARIKRYLSHTTLGSISAPTCAFLPSEPIGTARDFVESNNFGGVVVADECSPIGFASADLLQQQDRSMELGNLELPPVACFDSSTAVSELFDQFAAHPNLVVLELLDYRPVGYLTAQLLTEALQTKMRRRKTVAVT